MKKINLNPPRTKIGSLSFVLPIIALGLAMGAL